MGRKPKLNSKRAVLTVRLTPEQLAKLRKVAAERRRTPSEIARYLIEKGLKEMEGEKINV
ncbi:MAG: hypothetical protein QXW39_02970 [Candidatus Bathyarchaeia archaeon]